MSLQVLQPGPTAGAALGGAVGQGISAGLQMMMEDKINKMQAQRRAQALEAAGIPGELAGLDPAILREFAKTQAQQQAIQSLFGVDQRKAVAAPDILSSVTPEGEAALPLSESKAALQPPIGGAQKLKQMSDEQLQILQGFPAFKDIAKSELDIRATGKKESARTEENRYKANLPLYIKDQEAIEGKENQNLRIDRLEALNNTGKLPSGLGRINVGLKSGELIFPFAANPETQAFIKTLNDFTVEAKNTFGARVTNFELERFMKRLPTLLNSKEGRAIILKQMKLMTEIDLLDKQGVVDAFEEAGGLRKIDYDQAKSKAKSANKSKREALRKEYLALEKEGEKDVKEAKAPKVPEGSIEVISPDGQRGYLPKSQLKGALKAGYKRGS